jgi:hypothetical protein
MSIIKLPVQIIVCFLLVFTQQKAFANVDTLISELDQALEAYNAAQILTIVEQGLASKDLNTSQQLDFRIGGIKALEISENHDLAIELSNQLLENYDLTQEQEINLRLIRALCLEILNIYKKSWEESDLVKNLSAANKNTEAYGVYL